MVTYSRPGYGDSTPPRGRSVADAAADTAAILDALGVDDFLALGWSGGGPHALACAALLPGRCTAAVSLAGVAPRPAVGLDWLSVMGEENVEEFTAAGWPPACRTCARTCTRTKGTSSWPSRASTGYSTTRWNSPPEDSARRPPRAPWRRGRPGRTPRGRRRPRSRPTAPRQRSRAVTWAATNAAVELTGSHVAARPRIPTTRHLAAGGPRPPPRQRPVPGRAGSVAHPRSAPPRRRPCMAWRAGSAARRRCRAPASGVVEPTATTISAHGAVAAR